MVRWTEAPEEPAYDLAESEFEIDSEPRRRRGIVTFLLVVLALAFLAYGAMRVFSLDSLVDNAFLIGVTTLAPYFAAGCLLLALFAFLLRRRVLALFALVITLVLGSLLGPRLLSEEQPAAGGPHLRIMAANLYLGQADPRTIVNLVRQQKVDVLALPELTPAAVSALDAAGLMDVLPYRVFDDRVGGDGNGIAAKFPLRKIILMPDSALSQQSAVVDLPGREDLELTAIHVQPPLSDPDVRVWRNELGELPRATPDKRVRILAGDFNATLDHAAFRDLVDRGYADAGEEAGDGLDPTWSSLPTGPPLTIDHIVVDSRCAISSYAVFDLPGSDHNAIISEVILPD
jgi:endonuclease/exonuclease/phosphatase (EEP) superfamily protein YafD